MRNDMKNKNLNCGTIFFIILFLVFAMIYSDRSKSQTLKSSEYSFKYDLTAENGSLHFDATIICAVSITDLYKNGVNSLKCSGFNLFSSEYRLTGYNQGVTRNLTDIQKTNHEIEPLFLRRLLYHLSSGEKEDLPFLS